MPNRPGPAAGTGPRREGHRRGPVAGGGFSAEAEGVLDDVQQQSLHVGPGEDDGQDSGKPDGGEGDDAVDGCRVK